MASRKCYHQGNLRKHGWRNRFFHSFWVCVKGKRDREETGKNLHKTLERKAELAVRGERIAQQKLYEAEADVEVKHWEKKNADMALNEVNQEFDSQRFQPHQASRRADQAQRQN